MIFRKLSFGTESTSGSRTLEVAMPVLKTLRRHGRHALTGITEAVARHFQNQPAPNLILNT